MTLLSILSEASEFVDPNMALEVYGYDPQEVLAVCDTVGEGIVRTLREKYGVELVLIVDDGVEDPPEASQVVGAALSVGMLGGVMAQREKRTEEVDG